MGSTTVGTASVLIVPGNSQRKTITFTNRSAAGQVITLDNTVETGLTTTNGGYVIAPGAAIAFILDLDGPDIQNAWSAVADAAGGLLFWKETAQR